MTDPTVSQPGAGAAASVHAHQSRSVDAYAQPTWTLVAVAMLILPIVVAMLIKTYDVNRTVLLAIQYFIWCGAAFVIVISLPRQPGISLRLPSRTTRFLLLFLVAFGIATVFVWSSGVRWDMKALALQSAALIFMALPFFVLKRASAGARIDRVVIWTCHAVLAFCLYSVLGEVFGITSYEGGAGRFFGPLGDQVAWALTLPLVVYFSTRKIPLALLAGVGLALTASRAPALCSVAALLLLLLFSRGRRLEYGALVFALLAISLYQAGLFSTLLSRISATEFMSNDRTATAALGLKIFRDSPIFGSGYNSLTYFYPSTTHRISLGILPAQTSTFVQILSDGGLASFIPYLCFVIAATAAGIALIRNSKYFPEGPLMNGAAAWLMAMLWVNQSALWFVVGSYIGPLVFGIAGIVAGAQLRLEFWRQSSPIGIKPPQQWPLRGVGAGR